MKARKPAGKVLLQPKYGENQNWTLLFGGLCGMKVSVNILEKESAKGRSVSRGETLMKWVLGQSVIRYLLSTYYVPLLFLATFWALFQALF